MNKAMRSALAVVGVVAMAVVLAPAVPSFAQGLSATTIELSAQQNKKKDFKAIQQHRMQGNPSGQKNFIVQKNLGVQKNIKVQKNIGVKKTFRVQKNIGVNKGFVERKKIGAKKAFVGQKAVRKFTPKGAKAKIVVTSKFRGLPKSGVGHAHISGRNFSVWRSGHRFRYHGGWRTFVALSALGVIAIGAAEYYPYAYIDAPEDYCDGLTEDGCQLVWQDVETEEGDEIPQCVTYCPWQ